MKRIVCFGPGPVFKGGISNYNTSLAKALDRQEDTEVHIVSWTQQYPAIIPREFLDKKSKKDLLAGTDIQVHYTCNYNNPLTWRSTVQLIRKLNPDMVIFQWAIAIQGIPLGFIAKRLRRKTDIEIIFDLHFVKQKEGSRLDQRLTAMGIRHAHTYIAHAYKTVRELQDLFPDKNFFVNENGHRNEAGLPHVIKLYHPIYDMFEPDPDFDVKAFKKKHGLKEHVFLFFGFIRKYKGLHQAIRAFHILSQRRNDVSLIICGESFWKTLDQRKWSTQVKQFLFSIGKTLFLKDKEDESSYRPLELIDTLNLRDLVMVKNEFVPNEDVHKYFQASDAVLLFYLTATPSGVESLSYNFNMPILATNVGHFPETIQDGFNGYLAEQGDLDDMANVMEKAIEVPIDRQNVKKSTEKMSWENYAKAILKE